MKRFIKISIVFLLLIPYNLFSQRVGIYCSSGDATNNSDETIKTMCDVAGFPVEKVGEKEEYSEDLDVLKAILDYDVIFLADCDKLTLDEDTYLRYYTEFLTHGGLLFCDYYSQQLMSDIYGVTIQDKVSTHSFISIDCQEFSEGISWLDDPLEQVIPLCKPGKTSFSVLQLLLLTNASSIAHYEDGTVAVSCKTQGKGKAYFFGASWKRLVSFPRTNHDITAQRTFSNGFEPGADIVPLWIRGIVEDHFSTAVWKHTLPYDYQSALMITHDVHSATAYDNAEDFIAYEQDNSIPSHYFLSTKYVDDTVSCPYYEQSTTTTGTEVLRSILDANLTVGSQGVGCYSDFDDEGIFTLGTTNVSKTTYAPFNDGDVTVGGTVLGELVVSKHILEEDGVASVRSFRSGSMDFNKLQSEALESVAYTVESSFNANDVMTGFPYFLQKEQSPSEPKVDVLEIPLHISDAILNKSNGDDVVDTWLSVIDRYSKNYAPVVLSTATDKLYKQEACKALIEGVEGQTHLVNFEDMNDFWRKRERLTYTADTEDEVLTITIPDEFLPLPSSLSLHINKGKDLEGVVVKSSAGTIIDHVLQDWGDNSYLLRFESKINDFELNRTVIGDDLEASFSVDAQPIQDFDSLLWYFGDGTSSFSTDSNDVVHLYSSFGDYSVSLSIWHGGVKTEIIKNNVIHVTLPPIASFGYSLSNLAHYAPLSVRFYDTSFSKSKEGMVYKWSFMDQGVEQVADSSSFEYEFTQPGVYHISYEILDVNGYQSFYDQDLVVKDPSQSSDMPYVNSQSMGDISVQPNPTDGFITIRINDRSYCNTKAEFFDMQGRKISQISDISGAIRVPISSGVCLLKLTVGDEVYLRRVIKL